MFQTTNKAHPSHTQHRCTAKGTACHTLGFLDPGFTLPFELVLKVRIQSHKENDFIEVELDRQELSYQNLLQASCYELGINPEQVEKIRKLPNTLLRKDKDILRLQDFQEVELILMKNGSSALTEYTPSLLEKPCYNSNAAKMTY
ncbi:putative ANKRD40 C-terminal-like protein isoform X2 [Ovis aries]|uniref:ANKRD40 C-terminal like n=1 Tax=Ovis aries TaxID=9940 RepID=A0AC11DFK5_SHEEP|nr:putative ANKRD40 C-terminal-like protein isoform X2 [Ovis aries]